MTDFKTAFTTSKEVRDKKCEEKDLTLKSLLDRVIIGYPDHTHALLMPGLYGMELDYLQDKGVPAGNLFVIEKDRSVYDKIINAADHGLHTLVGVRPTPVPMRASEAMDHIYAQLDEEKTKLDLIYLDFFGRFSAVEHGVVLEKIFEYRMLADPGALILTFGKTRTNKVATMRIEEILKNTCDTSAVELFVDMLIHKSGHPMYESFQQKAYQSYGTVHKNHSITYTTFAYFFGSNYYGDGSECSGEESMGD